MKYFKKKTEKTLVLKYPEIRSYVSTIPWSYKKKILNRPVLYTSHYGNNKTCLKINESLCRKKLHDVSKDYAHLAQTVASLYEALQTLCLLQPGYHMSWSSLKRCLLQTLASYGHANLKGACQAARAKQVEAFCLTRIFAYLGSTMTRRHFHLLLFLHSLQSSSSSLSTNVNYVHLFHAALKSATTQSAPHNENVESSNANGSSTRPEYIDAECWAKCAQIERMHPSRFASLTGSLRQEALRWIEYFQLQQHGQERREHLDAANIDLLNRTPVVDLDALDKLLLWMCMRPADVSIPYIVRS